MPTLVEQAKAAVSEARAKNRCADRARQVERALEDLNDASSAGTGQVVLGGVVFGVGVLVGVLSGWTGVGLGAAAGLCGAGAVGAAAGVAAKADAMKRASKQLQRALDDLRECLAS